jgi:hypothetical protein
MSRRFEAGEYKIIGDAEPVQLFRRGDVLDLLDKTIANCNVSINNVDRVPGRRSRSSERLAMFTGKNPGRRRGNMHIITIKAGSVLTWLEWLLNHRPWPTKAGQSWESEKSLMRRAFSAASVGSFG